MKKCTPSAGVTDATPDVSTAVSGIDTEAVTPLCLGLDNLQLSALSSKVGGLTLASVFNDLTAATNDLAESATPLETTPALTGAARGWDRSLFDAPGGQTGHPVFC